MKSLLQIQDDLDFTVSLVEAAYMACATINADTQSDAVKALLNLVSERIQAASGDLQAARLQA